MSPSATSQIDVRAVVDEAVASRAEALHAVGRFLWENPETRFEEHKAHDTLCVFLESEGFDVRRHHVLRTAFRAEYGAGSPVVALLCEYDALPGLGHACGHNLIAESAVSAAVAARELIRRSELCEAPVKGKIVVLGTPAEEGGMGKELLLRAGALDDVDAALMAHPENRAVLRLHLSARCGVSVTFDTIDVPDGERQPSAMDASVLAYHNMSLLRASMDPECRMHGVLSTEMKTGFDVRRSRLDMNVRAPNTQRVLQMRRDIEACANAAAKATGCHVTIAEMGPLCKHMNYNESLLRIFQKHADEYGMTFNDGPVITGSTSDVGNVSHRLPTIHPVYRIESATFNHTTEFCRVAGTRKAQETALLIGKMLALTAFDLLRDPRHLECAKKEFERCAALVV